MRPQRPGVRHQWVTIYRRILNGSVVRSFLNARKRASVDKDKVSCQLPLGGGPAKFKLLSGKSDWLPLREYKATSCTTTLVVSALFPTFHDLVIVPDKYDYTFAIGTRYGWARIVAGQRLYLHAARRDSRHISACSPWTSKLLRRGRKGARVR